MKKSRFREEQIAHAIKQSESGTKGKEICRKMGISDATPTHRFANGGRNARGWSPVSCAS